MSTSLSLPFRGILTGVALLLSFASAGCSSSAGPLSMEVMVDGVPLPDYAARGTTYIEALRGREYSVRLTNRSAGRLAVALSIDGRNVIDARHSSAAEARKWILDPWQSIVLDGWQTSDTSARNFYFTTEPDSYASLLGDLRNTGAIEAIAYRERGRPRPVPPPCLAEEPVRPMRSDRENGPAPSSAPSAAGEAGGRLEGEQHSGMDRDSASALKSDDYAATGIGREIDHRVMEVSFEAEPRPCGRIRLRYEYHDALVRLGVLPPSPRPDQPLARRETARGFAAGPWCPVPAGR